MDIATATLRTFALTHNYNRWVFEILRPYIGEHILEVGCGIGNLTVLFKNTGKLTCIDKSSVFIQHMKIDYPGLEFYQFDITDNSVLSLAHKNFDTALCVNVLEHIRDDEKALSNMFKLLKPGGRLLLYVPALSSIYGTLDKGVGHFRRYDRGVLESKVRQAGFHIERISFTNILGMIGWFVNGKLFRKKQLSVLQTIMFDKFIPLLSRLEKKIHPCVGLGIITVAKKPVEKGE